MKSSAFSIRRRNLREPYEDSHPLRGQLRALSRRAVYTSTMPQIVLEVRKAVEKEQSTVLDVLKAVRKAIIEESGLQASRVVRSSCIRK